MIEVYFLMVWSLEVRDQGVGHALSEGFKEGSFPGLSSSFWYLLGL